MDTGDLHRPPNPSRRLPPAADRDLAAERACSGPSYLSSQPLHDTPLTSTRHQPPSPNGAQAANVHPPRSSTSTPTPPATPTTPVVLTQAYRAVAHASHPTSPGAEGQPPAHAHAMTTALAYAAHAVDAVAAGSLQFPGCELGDVDDEDVNEDDSAPN
eukprot:IDg23705t1